MYAFVAEPTASSIEAIQEMERNLLKKREELDTFRSEFLLHKKNYENAVAKIEAETSQLDHVLNQRDQLYADFVKQCSRKYANGSTSKPPDPSSIPRRATSVSASAGTGVATSASTNPPGASGSSAAENSADSKTFVNSIWSGLATRFRTRENKDS